jgi:hypothetical protein
MSFISKAKEVQIILVDVLKCGKKKCVCEKSQKCVLLSKPIYAECDVMYLFPLLKALFSTFFTLGKDRLLL